MEGHRRLAACLAALALFASVATNSNCSGPESVDRYRSSSSSAIGAIAATVVAVGILSTVAIPATIKYERKAKTAEAIDMLDKIYKGAAQYYAVPRVEEGGARRLDCQFPAD